MNRTGSRPTIRRTVGRGFGVSLVLVAVLLSGAPALPSTVTGPPHSAIPPRPSHGPEVGAYAHPPALGFGPSVAGRPRPAQGDEYYTQEGATIGQLNGSSATGMAKLTEFVRLRSSPYSTAYELNGLTNSGDWWQVTVGDNWPGCNSGFEELSEIWDNRQGSGPVTCSPNVTLSGGDLVELSLSFHSGEGCLGLTDLTAGGNYSYCQSQPDSGGTKWSFLDTASNGNGYYTGPMTEVINLTAFSCPDDTLTPRMEYLSPNGTHFTQYIPWSDEFDLATGTSCYTSGNGTQSITVGDPASYYADTAAGTGYGPHWVGGQNLSMLNRSYAFRFETDATPFTNVSLTGSPTTLTAGMTARFSLSAAGGSSPYRALWTLNGALQPIGPTSWNWTGGPPGLYTVEGYAVDTDDSVGGPSNAVVITVPGPLGVSNISATPSGGIDLGGSVQFSVGISGGFGYYNVSWTGLPTGCAPQNLSALPCAPDGWGAFNVSVTVRDENGSHVTVGPLSYRVYPALVVNLSRSASAIDLGESASVHADVSGGDGPYRFGWTMPSTCSGGGPEVNCTPVVTGPVAVSVTARDSLGTSTPVVGIAINVNPDLTLYVPAPRVATDQGVPFAVRVVANGGTAPFVFVWTGLPSGCASSTAWANCTEGIAGTYSLSARVLDATGAVAQGPTITVVAGAPPTVALSVSGSPSLAGAPVTFRATTAGGTAPYDYSWTGLPSGCTATNSPTIVCSPGEPGNYTVVVVETDAAGANVSATTTLRVAPYAPANGGSSPPLVSTDVALLLAVVAAAAVAAGVVIARRRRYR